NEYGDDETIPAYEMRISGVVADVCGNGVLEMLEQCDDGNNIDGDACTNGCITNTPNPLCGNGVLDVGDACDDGNNNSGDGCSAFCQEESITLNAPGIATQVVSHAIAPVQDFDVYTINVTSPSYVHAE